MDKRSIIEWRQYGAVLGASRPIEIDDSGVRHLLPSAGGYRIDLRRSCMIKHSMENFDVAYQYYTFIMMSRDWRFLPLSQSS